MFDIQQANIEAASILKNAKDELTAIYNHPDGATQQLRASSVLDRLINSLHVIGGTTGIATDAAKVQFEPVTSFMGEPIAFTKNNITAADAKPTLDEVEIYQKKVEDLYLSIAGMPNERVLTDYKGNESMELVLRGVAKKAGVQNYSNAGINTAFIDAIKDGIVKIDAEDELREQEEARLQASLANAPKAEKVVLTEQYLNAFPHLLHDGYKVGDSVDKALLNVEPDKMPPAPATEPVKQDLQADTTMDGIVKTAEKMGYVAPAAAPNKPATAKVDKK